MRCPVCRADNTQPPQCRRCKADLSLLFTLEEQRQEALAAAARHLLRGELGHARALAEGANALRGGEDARRLVALIHLCRRDFAAAWRGYAAAVQWGREEPSARVARHAADHAAARHDPPGG